MLKLGQFVTITGEPTRGYFYFNSDHIGKREWVSGTRMIRGKRCYQLNAEYDDCWWDEDNLSKVDDVALESEPTYELGDEVMTDDTASIRKVTSIHVYNGEFEYELDYEGPFAHEDTLTLHRKAGCTAAYTLF